MTVQPTSAQAYYDTRGWTTTLRERVLERIFFAPSTIRELAVHFKVAPNVISPRIDELRKEGRIECVEKRTCKVRNARAMEWRVRQTIEGQQEMF